MACDNFLVQVVELYKVWVLKDVIFENFRALRFSFFNFAYGYAPALHLAAKIGDRVFYTHHEDAVVLLIQKNRAYPITRPQVHYGQFP